MNDNENENQHGGSDTDDDSVGNADGSAPTNQAGVVGVGNKATKTTTTTTTKMTTMKKGNKRSSCTSLEPITMEGERPQKKFYRQRAHCNPLSHNDSFRYPVRPDWMDWTKGTTPNTSETSKAEQIQREINVDGILDCGPSLDSSPDQEAFYPNMPPGTVPTVLDIGCGFGGLTLALARILPPDQVIMGMEIRAKVTEFVRLRIAALRKEAAVAAAAANVAGAGAVAVADSISRPSHHPSYQNCSVMRTNAMKFLPHFFPRASLTKLFFCFPDPHFKRKNRGRRIVSTRLLTEYAYLLRPGVGRLYCVTDVVELHHWHVQSCQSHPSFRLIQQGMATQFLAQNKSQPHMLHTDEQDDKNNNNNNNIIDDNDNDCCISAMLLETEEGKKVARLGGEKYYAVYQRRADDEMEHITAETFFGSTRVPAKT